MIVFYYEILYKFSLVLFLAKFNESLKDIHLSVYFNRPLYIYEILNYMKIYIIYKLYIKYMKQEIWLPHFVQKCSFLKNSRLVGTFRMFLQELVEVGNVKICDSLLDSHNVVMRVGAGSLSTIIKRKLRLLTVKGSTLHWISYSERIIHPLFVVRKLLWQQFSWDKKLTWIYIVFI